MSAEPCASPLAPTPAARPGIRQLLRASIHFLAYHFILSRSGTRVAWTTRLRLLVPPTVFHPGWFITSRMFADFIATLDLEGKSVADVGTGSGILALAAARAGAASVLAIDINPRAARAAQENAKCNGFAGELSALCGNLLAAVKPHPVFDVIISSPPSFAGEAIDIADRAWHAGPAYRDIAPLFEQARRRLKPDGAMYLLLSSDSDLDLFARLIDEARFRVRLMTQKFILVETLYIYELAPAERLSPPEAASLIQCQ